MFDNSTFDEVLLVFPELMARIQELSMHVEARKLATGLKPTKLKSSLIRLQRIYNFLLFHAIILPVLDVYGLYFIHYYHFWD